MSVYSGFATRNKQKHYDTVLYNIISTLMVRIVKFYKSEAIEEKAFKKIIKQQSKMIGKLEKHKYLDPKYADLLEHFIRVLGGNQLGQNSHLQFEMRRKSIEQDQTFNRTFSVLGNELEQLNHFSQKIDTLQLEDLNSDKDLERIPERRQRQHTKKRNKKPHKSSSKSNIDIWDVRRQRLPEIPSLLPIEQTILGKTKFRNFSEKINNKTLDTHLIARDQSLNKIITKPPKFRAKMFFK